MRILLVEDESDLGTVIEKTLTRNRYIVESTTPPQADGV